MTTTYKPSSALTRIKGKTGVIRTSIHSLTHLPEPQVIPMLHPQITISSDVSPQPCSFCGRMFDLEYNRITHEKVHKRSHLEGKRDSLTTSRTTISSESHEDGFAQAVCGKIMSSLSKFKPMDGPSTYELKSSDEDDEILITEIKQSKTRVRFFSGNTLLFTMKLLDVQYPFGSLKKYLLDEEDPDHVIEIGELNDKTPVIFTDMNVPHIMVMEMISTILLKSTGSRARMLESFCLVLCCKVIVRLYNIELKICFLFIRTLLRKTTS